MVRIVNIKDLPWVPFKGPEPYETGRKHLTPHADACNLGASLYRLEPGRKSCPAHHHYGNDEAVFVVSGTLTLLLDGEAHTLAAGSYVTLPCGTGEAHQLENRTDTPADYLCFSTMNPADVVVYPDSGKVGLFGGVAPGGAGADTAVRRWVRDTPADYWDGVED
jgi:uncharacterized cupin superfamily protein